MREITVAFRITPEQDEKLHKAAAMYREKGYMVGMSTDDLFRALLQMGSRYLIDEKLNFAETNAAGVPARTEKGEEAE